MKIAADNRGTDMEKASHLYVFAYVHRLRYDWKTAVYTQGIGMETASHQYDFACVSSDDPSGSAAFHTLPKYMESLLRLLDHMVSTSLLAPSALYLPLERDLLTTKRP